MTLADEGFIHCSRRDQVEATANRFYGDVAELVLLTIDEAALDAPVVDEDLYDTGETLPARVRTDPRQRRRRRGDVDAASDGAFHSPIS